MDITFSGPVWHWRGPAPHHFVSVPPDESDAIAEIAPLVTYGWGMIPVQVRIGDFGWRTALWPKDDGYILGLTAKVRAAEQIEIGSEVEVDLHIDV